MNNLKNYTLIGFDFRVIASCPKTVDTSIWFQSEEVYGNLISQGCQENLVQLLNISEEIAEKYAEGETVGVAIAVSDDDIKVMEKMFGGEFIEIKKSPSYLLERGWSLEGFDVADANGYFSVFGITHENFEHINKKRIFNQEKDARKMIALANSSCPSHSPFLVFAVFSYKNKTSHD